MRFTPDANKHLNGKINIIKVNNSTVFPMTPAMPGFPLKPGNPYREMSLIKTILHVCIDARFL